MSLFKALNQSKQQSPCGQKPTNQKERSKAKEHKSKYNVKEYKEKEYIYMLDKTLILTKPQRIPISETEIKINKPVPRTKRRIPQDAKYMQEYEKYKNMEAEEVIATKPNDRLLNNIVREANAIGEEAKSLHEHFERLSEQYKWKMDNFQTPYDSSRRTGIQKNEILIEKLFANLGTDYIINLNEIKHQIDTEIQEQDEYLELLLNTDKRIINEVEKISKEGREKYNRLNIGETNVGPNCGDSEAMQRIALETYTLPKIFYLLKAREKRSAALLTKFDDILSDDEDVDYDEVEDEGYQCRTSSAISASPELE
ncbi:uncharacterized protein LOC103509176 [Diaphorina citri]|uniref:Uncharacterized protein LOC103509176 n=1 Tax=Diaphorina citri TaxID=121845 RepID=A0A1S3D177_DIACI|nr:uncharacterized protein LOC103509176 [Diaphorina citri]